MPTLSEISRRIEGILQDDLYTAEIPSYINEGISKCASLVLLPALETTGTVDTVVGSSEVDVPAEWNFDRNLYMADALSTQSSVSIFSSMALMQRAYPQFRVKQETGDIEALTIVGQKLVYYRIPTTAETLYCAFYQKPTLLVNGDDIPSCIPDFLQMRLLSSYACAEIYDVIEDGVDGVKINTQKHMATFNSAIDELAEFFRTGRSRPEPNRPSGWI